MIDFLRSRNSLSNSRAPVQGRFLFESVDLALNLMPRLNHCSRIKKQKNKSIANFQLTDLAFNHD